MVLTSFEILLDNPSSEYFTGSVISGHIFLYVRGEETTAGITIRLFGRAETHWMETRTIRQYHGYGEHAHYHYRTVHDSYDSDQSFFDSTVMMFGGDQLRPISQGETKIPFSFTLPSFPLAMSCNLDKGFVKYGLEGTMMKGLGPADPKCEKLFLIRPITLDLNTVPGALDPSRVTAHKAFGSCCCQGEPLIVSATTNLRGVCMGDQVMVAVEIHNSSGTPVSDTSAQFTQHWTCFATHGGIRHSRHQTFPFGAKYLRGQGVEPGATSVWQFVIPIPPDISPSPHDQACAIIRMEYCIELELRVDGEENLTANLPLIVGNNPLKTAIVSEHSSLYEGIGKT